MFGNCVGADVVVRWAWAVPVTIAVLTVVVAPTKGTVGAMPAIGGVPARTVPAGVDMRITTPGDGIAT